MATCPLQCDHVNCDAYDALFNVSADPFLETWPEAGALPLCLSSPPSFESTLHYSATYQDELDLELFRFDDHVVEESSTLRNDAKSDIAGMWGGLPQEWGPVAQALLLDEPLMDELATDKSPKRDGFDFDTFLFNFDPLEDVLDPNSTTSSTPEFTVGESAMTTPSRSQSATAIDAPPANAQSTTQNYSLPQQSFPSRRTEILKPEYTARLCKQCEKQFANNTELR